MAMSFIDDKHSLVSIRECSKSEIEDKLRRVDLDDEDAVNSLLDAYNKAPEDAPEWQTLVGVVGFKYKS